MRRGNLPQRRRLSERFVELIHRLLAANSDALVLITGAPSERTAAQKLASQCNDRCIAFAGQFTLSDLPALHSPAVTMVTVDSGPAHFAAARGLPTIVFCTVRSAIPRRFTRFSPARRAPPPAITAKVRVTAMCAYKR